MILRIGKYKYKSLENVIDDDPKYLLWLLDQPWFKQKYGVQYQWIKDRIPSIQISIRNEVASDDEELPFGKHKGKSLDYVADIDPEYLQWLHVQDWVREHHPKIANWIDERI